MRRSLLVSSIGVAAGVLALVGIFPTSAAAASHPARTGHQGTRGEVLRAVLAPSVPTDRPSSGSRREGRPGSWPAGRSGSARAASSRST